MTKLIGLSKSHHKKLGTLSISRQAIGSSIMSTIANECDHQHEDGWASCLLLALSGLSDMTRTACGPKADMSDERVECPVMTIADMAPECMCPAGSSWPRHGYDTDHDYSQGDFSACRSAEKA
jgi:hypothetical protein